MEINEAVTSNVTLGDLVTNYGKLYDSAVNCAVLKSDAAEDKEGTAKTFTATVRSATGGVHPVIVKLGKDRSGNYSLSSPCKVDCNCSTYVYRNNEALHKANASLYTRYTLRPTRTGRKANPESVVTCCKHIYGYVSFLLRRGDMHR